jgi:hypothetical protein
MDKLNKTITIDLNDFKNKTWIRRARKAKLKDFEDFSKVQAPKGSATEWLLENLHNTNRSDVV